MSQEELRTQFARGCFKQTDAGRYSVLIITADQLVDGGLSDSLDKAVTAAEGFKNNTTATEIYHLDKDGDFWLLRERKR
jgi:hypothetical protein